MEWARQQEVPSYEAKALLLLVADRADGQTHECQLHGYTLVEESGIPAGEILSVLEALAKAELVEAEDFSAAKAHPCHWRPPTRFRLLIPPTWRTQASGVPKRSASVESKPTAVYRLFSESGALLYVGISDDPEKRFTEHERAQYWWREVATREVVWHHDRFSAAAEEDRVIAVEQPEYNDDGATRVGASSHVARAKRRIYVVTRSRYDRFQQTTEALKRDIRARRFPDGFLPTVAELQQMYGVDEMTVRQTLHYLLARGHIRESAGLDQRYWWRGGW
jgi:predicted GIY-YIG superfamily endonuclease